MRPTCGACRWYEHTAQTDNPNPLTGQTRPGGFCHVREEEISEHTGVVYGRDLVDRGDWCPRWESTKTA